LRWALVPILALFIIPVGMAYADTTEEYGKNYNQIIDWETGIATWTSQPERIMIAGEWENYSFINNGNQVIFKSNSIGGLIYDKSSCSYSIYDTGFDGEQIIPSVSIQARSAINGTDVWSNLAVNNQSCDVDVIQNDKGIIITSTKLLQESETLFSANGTQISASPYDTERLSHELKLDVRNGIKETFRLYNIADDTKLGISQTIHTGNEIRIGDTTYDVASVNGQVFPKSWIIENEAEILGIADNLNYDFDIGIERLNAVRVIDDFGTSKVVMDYAASPGVENFIEIDPTFTGTVSTVRTIVDTFMDNTCDDDGSYASQTGQAYMTRLRSTADTTEDCHYAGFEFDISSLASGSVISDAKFQFEVNQATNTRDCDYIGMDVQPSTASAEAVFKSIHEDSMTGTELVASDSTCTSTGTNKEVDLGSAGDTYITNQVSSGWAGIGVRFDDMSMSSTVRYVGHDNSGTPNPTLVLTYAALPSTPTNLATTTGIPIELDWDAPADDGGSAITGYKVYRTTNQFALSDMPDSKGSDAQIDMAANEILLHLDSILGVSDFSDDFSSDAWTDTDSAIGITGGEMKFVASGGEDYIHSRYDLGSTVSDTAWVLRITVQTDHPTGNPFTYFGLSDSTSELDQTQDFLGYANVYNDNDWGIVYADGSSVPLSTNTVTSGSDTYYVEIKRTADDTATMNIWTGSYGGTLINSETRTDIPATVVDLQYIKIAAKDNYSQTVVWDSLEFYDGITSVSSPNTPDSSGNNYDASYVSGTIQSGIFDKEMLDPNLTFSGANIPDGTEAFTIGGWAKLSQTPSTFEDDFSGADNWTDDGTSVAVSTSNDVIEWDSVGDGSDNLTYYPISISDSSFIADFDITFDTTTTGSDGDGLYLGVGFDSITSKPNVAGHDSLGISFELDNSPSGTVSMSAYACDNINQYDCTTHHDGGTGDTSLFTATASASDTKNFRIIRDGASFQACVYTDATRTTSTECETVDANDGGTVSSLGYFKVWTTRDNTNDHTFDGTIDNVKIYNGVTSIGIDNTKFLGAGDITFNVDGTTAKVTVLGASTSTDIDREAGNKIKQDGGTYINHNEEDSDSANFGSDSASKYVGILYFDTSGIPDGSTITNIQFTGKTWMYAGSSSSNDMRKISTEHANNQGGANAGTQDMVDEIWGGSLYNTFSTSENAYVTYDFALGGTANADMQAQLGDDWFQIGVSKLAAKSTLNQGISYWHSSQPPELEVTYQSATTVITATISDSTAQDYFYTFTRDGNDWEIFQDGVSKGTATDSASMGTTPTYSINLSGTLDEFFINDVQESDADILTMSNRGVAPTVINSPTASEYDDSGVSGGNTYYYQTSAVNSIGESPKTAMVSGLAGTPPDAPTGVSTAIQNPDSAPLTVRVSWSTPSNVGSGTLTGFEIYRDGTLVTTTGLVNLYDATVSAANTAYEFKAKAVSTHGTSGFSNTSTITTPNVPGTPNAPSLAINNPNPNPLDVTVTWTAPSTGGSAITGYNVFSSPDNITYTSQANVTSGLTLTNTVNSAGTWYYKVAAQNLLGQSSQSAATSIATPTVPGIPATLTTAINSPNTAPYDVTLNWTAPTSDGGSTITGYNVYKKQGSGALTSVINGTTALTLTNTVNSSPATNFTFHVHAVNNVGEGNYKDSTITTLNVPSAVSDLAGTYVAPGIDLVWTAPSSDSTITQYQIYRDATPIALIGNTTTTYSDTSSFSSDSAYQFYIRAISLVGTSSNSNQITVQTNNANVADLTATSIGGTSLVLNWSAPPFYAGNVVGYQINYTTPTGNPLTKITNDTGTSTSVYQVGSLSHNTTYSFRVGVFSPQSFNMTGNILNVTTGQDYSITNHTVGSFDIDAINPDVLNPFKFQRTDDSTAGTTTLDITFPSHYDMSCDLESKFAQTNQTYTGLTSSAAIVSGDEKKATFSFTGLDNEIITVKCWDEITKTEQTFLLTQNSFPLLTQFAALRAGDYGTDGMFGAIDLIVLGSVIFSMVAFNRTTPIAGVIVAVMMIGVLAYFEIVQWPTVLAGAIAVIVMLALVRTRQR